MTTGGVGVSISALDTLSRLKGIETLPISGMPSLGGYGFGYAFPFEGN